MKNYKQILEAINRGIKLALDDFENDNEISSKSNIVDMHEPTKDLIWIHDNFVDLGLPSGTLWARYNLGANYEKLTNFDKWKKTHYGFGISATDWQGKYYAWGEIEPKPFGSATGWNNYKFADGVDSQKRPIFTKYITKYKNAHGHDITHVDNLTTLLPEDDAAYQFDNRMKMPSEKQLDELIDYCSGEWVIDYNGITGLNGAVYKGENGNEIFFPAAGAISQEGIRDIGQSVFLYSNKISTLNLKPIFLEIWGSKTSHGETVTDEWGDRFKAFSIRPVLNKEG